MRAVDRSHDRQCPCKVLPQSLSSFTAAEYGDLLSLSRLGPAVIDRVDAGGYTPLHLAAQNGHVAATAYLLSLGADVDGRVCHDSNSTFSMAESSQSSHLCGATPLHRAAYSGAISAMQVLLDWANPDNGRRCDILATDTSFGDGMTPLHKAASGGRFLAVRLLLDALKTRHLLREGLVALDVLGRTPLEVARFMALKQEEEINSVRRWDTVAGGPASWEKCVKLLEAAQISEAVISSPSTQAPLPQYLSGTNALQCLECGAEKDGRCKTASWETTFRLALATSAEEMMSQAQLAKPDCDPSKSLGSVPMICWSKSESGNVDAKKKSQRAAATQTESSNFCLGNKCDRCGEICLILFRDKQKGLVCKGCRKLRA